MSTAEFERGLEAHQARAESKAHANLAQGDAEAITREQKDLQEDPNKSSAFEWYLDHKLRVFTELSIRLSLAEDYLLQPPEPPEEWDRIFAKDYAGRITEPELPTKDPQP